MKSRYVKSCVLKRVTVKRKKEENFSSVIFAFVPFIIFSIEQFVNDKLDEVNRVKN